MRDKKIKQLKLKGIRLRKDSSCFIRNPVESISGSLFLFIGTTFSSKKFILVRTLNMTFHIFNAKTFKET